MIHMLLCSRHLGFKSMNSPGGGDAQLLGFFKSMRPTSKTNKSEQILPFTTVKPEA